MRSKLEEKTYIHISDCGNRPQLSLPGCFTLFMDMATVHGEELGMGMKALAEKGIIWVASKTRILIHRWPEMLEEVTVATWPETPGRLRCNRFYSMHSGGIMIAEGKTEWIMFEPATGKMVKTEGNYPADIEHCGDVVCNLPFSRIDDHFEDCTQLCSYTVSSRDIDISQHMNNVHYVRALMGALTTKQIEELNITGAEAIFRIQCYEGEVLSIRMREWENGIDLAAVKEDGKTAMILRLTCNR